MVHSTVAESAIYWRYHKHGCAAVQFQADADAELARNPASLAQGGFSDFEVSSKAVNATQQQHMSGIFRL